MYIAVHTNYKIYRYLFGYLLKYKAKSKVEAKMYIQTLLFTFEH